MAQYNGFVPIPHNSYESWKVSTLGSGYNYDGQYGNQCWDYVQECYAQYGLTLYTKPGGGGACDCWLISKDRNTRGPFIAVEGRENIKRGDIIVWNRNPYSSVGHIAFADEDYNGTNSIRTVAQIPSLYGIDGTVHVHDESLRYFLGIFRNREWVDTPAPGIIEKPKKKNKFPWIVAWNNWQGYR